MTKLHIEKDYLVFENIGWKEVCSPFERLMEYHKVLYVPRDIFRDAEKSPLLMNAHQASVYCEQQGQFQPCFALTCSILRMVLHQLNTTNDLRLREYLELYKTAGLHLQNTKVDFSSGLIIHTVDFDEKGNRTALRQRIELPFKKEESMYYPFNAGEILRCILGGKRLKKTLYSTGLGHELLSKVDIGDQCRFIVNFVRILTGLADYGFQYNVTLGELGELSDILSEPHDGSDKLPHSTYLSVPKLLHGTYGTALGCDPVSGRFSVHVDIPGTALAVRGARNDRPSSLEDIK